MSKINVWKIRWCLLCCLLIGGLVFQGRMVLAEEDYFKTLNVGRFEEPIEVPDFLLPQLGGGELRLSEYKGHVVLLNFWATWCPHCVHEREGLQHLYEAYKDEGLVIIAVSIDRGSSEHVKKFLESKGLTFVNVQDKNSATLAEYGIRGVPATIIIAPSGMALGGVLGPREWGSDEAGRLIEHILADYKDTVTP
ncbi:hypothetical protein CSB45_03985 [candidate division KSB3 bacterium]|uniref:Thioredoxin domain-containing protein n=1 Tax=candidate division KSB3 bacterium TaxID=2044937 RepID=A0A2G6E811_9BACT|nr:MAG: hypothetical protein CSB45_03985 [candidate division KSB3 bacterium]PIE30540.1 MAG: hypothetical protein CSA57_02570 [candidate division KSB3 bacterium]